MATSLLSCALASAFAWAPATVTSVTFQPERVAALADLQSAFGVTAGQPLSRVAIRRGVQALVASRAVEDVAVELSEQLGGVELRVTMQLASRITAVDLVGVPRRERAAVLADLGIAVGDPLLVASFESGLERARTRLRERGFFAAALEPQLDFDVPRGTVRVTVAAALGRPMLLGALEAPGADLSAEEVRRRTRLEPGDQLAAARLEEARRRLLRSLRRDGFWESEVAPPEVAEVTGNSATVRLAVDKGRCWRLDLERLPQSRALEREALPFLRGEEQFSEATLPLNVARVRTFLQRRGRLLAAVAGEVDESGECRTLRLRVDHDEKTPIRAIRFPGLDELEAEALRARIGARLGHPWWWGREPIDDDSLAADTSSVRATLLDDGYAEATVAAPRLSAEDGGVAIDFPVSQGPRHLVASLEVAGVPAATAGGPLPLAVGGPWSADREARARDAVQLALEDAGFAGAEVVAAHQCADSRCSVTITATPGAPVLVSHLVVTGLSRTRRSVVDKVARLAPGSPLGPSQQLAAQRRLLGLGVFQRAALRPIPRQDSGEALGYVLDLAEAPTGAFGFGLGWDTVERLRVSASWSEMNLFGRAAIVAFQGRYSDRQRTFEVSYRESGKLGLLGFPNWTSVYRTEEHYPSFDLLRRGMWIQLGDLQARPWRRLLRYDYQIVDSDAPDEILSDLERDQQNVRLASVTPILEWDTRDDIFTPRSGTFASAQLQVAFEAFLGETEFEKLSASVARFQPLLGGVLAASARTGVIWPRPSVSGPCDVELSPSGCANLAVPIAVRLFGGGRISHRAFATDLLGLPGKTLICPSDDPDCTPAELEPVGGAATATASMEWRFPLYDVIGGSVFVDVGNVWAAPGDASYRDLRWGAGIGLRVETPVGPIRLEYGWKLDREPGERRGELFLSLGNPF